MSDWICRVAVKEFRPVVQVKAFNTVMRSTTRWQNALLRGPTTNHKRNDSRRRQIPEMKAIPFYYDMSTEVTVTRNDQTLRGLMSLQHRNGPGVSHRKPFIFPERGPVQQLGFQNRRPPKLHGPPTTSCSLCRATSTVSHCHHVGN